MSESPVAPPPPPKRKNLFVALGAIGVACLLVGLFVRMEVHGPRAPGAPAPMPALAVYAANSPTPLAEGATVPGTGALKARVTLSAPAKISLVHVDVGHGLEPLALNVALGPGEHPLDAALDLRDLSGPQVLAAVASERDLVQDEALSAARGLAVPNTTVAVFHFSVGP